MIRIVAIGFATFLASLAAVGAYGQDNDSGPAPSPRCADLWKGSDCWWEFANKRGCHYLVDHFRPGKSATWSGACSGSIGIGHGTLRWTEDGKSNEGTGVLDRGRMRGRWVLRSWDGTVIEGSFEKNRRHGRWVYRFPSGNTEEGSYVYGSKNGQWITRFASGALREGPYVGGRMHGRWVHRFPSGGRVEYECRHESCDGQPGLYANRHGQSVSGSWSGGCFWDRNGVLRAKRENRTVEECYDDRRGTDAGRSAGSSATK